MAFTRREFLDLGVKGVITIGATSIIGVPVYSEQADRTGANSVIEHVVTDTSSSPSAKLRSIGIDDFNLTSSFWKPKIDINHDVSLPHQYNECERTGRIDNFRYAAGEKDCGRSGLVYNDSDVYKWAEAVIYDQVTRQDDKLKSQLDEFIRLVAKSQDDDGYLNTAFMGDNKAKRWQNLFFEHELYCGGHMIQAAVAHHRMTGEKTFLNVAEKWADCVCNRFGRNETPGAPGHQEVEMALIELYRTTGAKQYLKMATVFLERRGTSKSGMAYTPEFQNHKPIRKQKTVTGHAVRQLYQLCGIADLYAENSDISLFETMNQQWNNFTERKMYVTGGAGSRYSGESFGEDYELPNRTAYSETCAAISSFMWNWRMLQLTGEAKFADVMETVLYNGVLSGMSLDGMKYFYTNPLEHDGGDDLADHHRGSCRRTTGHWDATSCCPPNVGRTLASLSSYFHGLSDDSIFIHHYSEGVARFKLAGTYVRVSQTTEYPWEGKVKITVTTDTPTSFKLMLRVPAWCESADVKVNGKDYSGTVNPNSYIEISRPWASGDTVELYLPMAIRRVVSHPNVEENVGRIALARGPFVYCVEAFDHQDIDISQITIHEDIELSYSFNKQLLGGVGIIQGEARLKNKPSKKYTVTAIPYFSWTNRTPGAMRVWLPVV